MSKEVLYNSINSIVDMHIDRLCDGLFSLVDFTLCSFKNYVKEHVQLSDHDKLDNKRHQERQCH